MFSASHANSGASEQRLIRSYKRSFNAFAAELSEEEMKTIAGKYTSMDFNCVFS